MEEEYLLNFVVNNLDEEHSIDLGGDVEVTTENLYKILASTGGASINHVCGTTDYSPHANSLRRYLTK